MMRQLTPLDAHFLAIERTGTVGHVAGVFLFDPCTAPGGRLTLDALRELVLARLHLLPPFRRRLVATPLGVGHPYWVDDPDFAVDAHLREHVVRAPGDERYLCDLVAQIIESPLERTRPLWELHLVHGVAGGRVALVAKIHHAAIDGVAGGELMSILFDAAPCDRAPESTPPQAPPGALPGRHEVLARTLLAAPWEPLRAARALPRTLRHLDDVAPLRVVPGVRAATRARNRLRGAAHAPLQAPRTRLNRRLSEGRRFAITSLALDDIRDVQDAFAVTVNDVVMALCASALRSYLLAHGELPSVPLVAMVPVSLRTPEVGGRFGNRISTMVAPLPTDEPDPRQRLLTIRSAMRSAKERQRAVPSSLLRDATGLIPPPVFTRTMRVIGGLAVREPLSPPCNVVISNVRGSQVPLYCAGAALLGQFPASILVDGVGLNFTVLSYRGSVGVGLVADRELVPDLWRLVADLRSAMTTLTHLARKERLDDR